MLWQRHERRRLWQTEVSAVPSIQTYLYRKEGDSTGPLGQDPVTWYDLPQAIQGVPSGQRGAGERGRLHKGIVARHGHQCLLVDDHVVL